MVAVVVKVEGSSAKLSEIYGVALSSFAYCSKEGDGAARIRGGDGEGEHSGMKPGRPSGVPRREGLNVRFPAW